MLCTWTRKSGHRRHYPPVCLEQDGLSDVVCRDHSSDAAFKKFIDSKQLCDILYSTFYEQVKFVFKC